MSTAIYCKEMGDEILLETHYPIKMTCFRGHRMALETYLEEIAHVPVTFRFYSPQTDLTAAEFIAELDRRNKRPDYIPPVALSNGSRSSSTPRTRGRSVD